MLTDSWWNSAHFPAFCSQHRPAGTLTWSKDWKGHTNDPKVTGSLRSLRISGTCHFAGGSRGRYCFAIQAFRSCYRGQERCCARRVAGVADGANVVTRGETGRRGESAGYSSSTSPGPTCQRTDACYAAGRGGSTAVCDGAEAPPQNAV